jgi:hypothetical protein
VPETNILRSRAGAFARIYPQALRRGVDRFSTVRMRSMSLFEARVSSGLLSFASLLNGERQRSARSEATLDDCLSWITTGGWPDLITDLAAILTNWVHDYLRNSS